jgi:type VI secretion system protein ImpA
MTIDGLDLDQPIQADRPCGENLEETPLMASIDADQLFGQPVALDPTLAWPEIKGRALEALRQSKDIRALTYLSAAVLRTDGLLPFLDTLGVASRWLEAHWDNVFPLIDEDAMVRRNALSGFADSHAILDALRRAPVVSSRQHGRFSLRDIEIASGNLAPAEGDKPPEEGQINAAFATVPLDSLLAVQQGVAAATAAVKDVDARMRSGGGSEAAPALDRLIAELARMTAVVQKQLAGRPDAPGAGAGEAADGGAEVSGGAGPVAVGAIRSRQDAVRAMEFVAEFFRRNEPSSPLPLLLERASRLVSKSFLEVLADMAPDGVAQARSAGGLRKDEQ